MNQKNLIPNQHWDVIVIGTGMGGATIGYELAKKGHRILFIEKGGDIDNNTGWTDEANPTKRIEQGWWPHPFSQQKPSGKYERYHIAVGCGLGGSSIHYGGSLERFETIDFEAITTANGQTKQPWPVSYAEFEAYYKKAETLYGITAKVNGDRPPLSDWDSAFVKVMEQNGLKPERLNVAINYDPDCEECIGKICHRRCKADAKSACLEKALSLPNCDILDYCDVQLLEADATHVKQVTANKDGQTINLKAKIIILSAGAMHSPLLLLKSKNSFWPNGLSNRSDQVGRNLMFHVGDMYAVWSNKKISRQGRQKKSISIRDFYVKDGLRLGHIQSLGMDAGQGHIAMFIKDTLRRYGIHNELLLKLLVKIPAVMASMVLGKATLFGVNIEDDPNPDNRIKLNPEEPNGASFQYTITDDIQKRADILFKSFSKAVKPWRSLRIMPSIEINHGHACGTCRFGNDPADSVLNANCRSHDVDNLYVVDSSFMPRSGAANPSLTIAANAIRVSEHIHKVLSTE